MIYAYGDDIQPYRADDIPSLSAWIKKSKSQKGLGFFVIRVRKRTDRKPSIFLKLKITTSCEATLYKKTLKI